MSPIPPADIPSIQKQAAKVAFDAFHATYHEPLGTQLAFEDLSPKEQQAWALVAGAVISFYHHLQPEPLADSSHAAD
jgi:hypothetical protein